MSPTLFTLSRLPPVLATTADAIGAMSLRRQQLAKPREILVAPFGRITLRCIDIGVPAPPRQDCESWSVFRVRGSEPPGALVLDQLTALRLMYTSLGLPGPRTFRLLGHTERGIAAATLAAVVRRFSNELALSLERPGRLRHDLVRLTIAMEFDQFREHVHLLVPPSWFPEVENQSIADEAARRGLELPLAVELGRTDLRAADWAGATTGDAVVFDALPYPSDDKPWPVQLACGAHEAAAQWSPEGLLTVTSRFEAIGTSGASAISPTPLTQESASMSTSSKDRSSRADALIATAPIEVVAEVGRIVLRAEEVLALGPGSVLPLASLHPESVDLRVGSRTWARGELVDVEGRLGVRLTRLISDGGSAGDGA